MHTIAGKTAQKDTEAAAILALMRVPGVGRVAVRQVVHAARVAGMPIAALLGMSRRKAAGVVPVGFDRVPEVLARCGRAHVARAEQLLRDLTASGIMVLCLSHQAYPESLSRSLGKAAPPLLFISGNPALLEEPAAAVVGARLASQRGLALAGHCARTFSEAGVPVVSGGAAGVDTSAHAGAVESGGKTVVVLPQGILTYRPLAFIERAIAAGRASVVSEFLPDAAWETHAAVTRNATISALARMVCVIEPRKVGGSMCTARCAFEQGKRVVAYCPDRGGLARRHLRHAGALDLVGDSGRLNAGRLLELWRSASDPWAAQGELL